jgi:hypothetical protein
MPEGVAGIQSLGRVWTREMVLVGEAVLLLLGLGLTLARGLWLGRPLGHLTRSASAAIARHLAPFLPEHPYQ